MVSAAAALTPTRTAAKFLAPLFAAAAPAAPAAARTMATAAAEKTFQNQSKLPHLPVPSIEETRAKFLKSCIPIARSQGEWDALKAKWDDFVEGKEAGKPSAKELQDRLLKFAKEEEAATGNWLDRLWLRKAYLEYRDSVVINVSYWMAFDNSPLQPAALLANPPAAGTFSEWQLKRAANLTRALLVYKGMIDREEIAPEYGNKATKTQPMCMHQFKLLFGGQRFPAPVCDTIATPFPAAARHIAVMARDQIYAVEVVGADGTPAAAKEIEAQLAAVVADVQKGASEPPVGILSTVHRDRYVPYYNNLLKAAPGNKESMKVLEDALFLVALDDYSTNNTMDEYHLQWMCNHRQNCANRFVDKELQIIVANNGRAGVMGEHSPADAAVPNMMFDWALKNEADAAVLGGKQVSLAAPKKLKFVADGQVSADIAAAQRETKEWVGKLDSVVAEYNTYGAGWVKKNAKISPDAYAQMCLQLTFARLYKWPTATYETASTRQQLLGRTETTRTCSVDSEKWARSFDSNTISDGEKLKRLRAAATAHIAYAREAAQGKGVDRHSMALKSMLKPGEAAPALFGDELYQRSFHHRISTSNLSVSAKTLCGFGPTAEDGYGSNYNVQEEWMKFSISSRKDVPDVDSNKFRATLIKVFDDVRASVEKGMKELGENVVAAGAKAKL
ncbi:acyltransferase ChoActase/COT/CPT [Hyaloraphidium curvatum]|nr:acyltransferase ChoActase/COT/CPT [Hyaloraphidium curvatum]